MKVFTFGVLVSLLTACGAVNSPSSSSIKESTQMDEGIQYPNLPVLEAARVIVRPAPGLAAVQPTAHLAFSYDSCAKFSWNVARETRRTMQGNVTYIQINVSPLQMDCMGPVIKHDYKVQISSDTIADGQFVLINPSVLAETQDNK